eukprot:TRINITY_DN17513_c0_g1_i1.p1 TRINITY_DN17513_c0_g1~~TRINITY_DN17513_c0_g1_i1.p1  ORF type:complete len:786 (+),score=242.18 TRINITY_DN17513_c0_g1_i1:40-2397(+)
MKMEPLKPSKLANKPSGKYAHVKSKVGSVRKAGEASKPTPKPPAKRSAPKEPITPARGRPAARTLSAPRTASKKKMCSSSPAKKVPLRTATPQKKKAKTKEKKVTIVSPSEDAKQHVEEVKTVEPTPVSTSASAPSPVAPAHKKVTVEYQGRSRYPNPLSGGFRPGALIPASRESTDDDLCVSEDTAQSTPVKHSPFAISPFTESPFCKIKTPEALKLSQKLFASSPEMFKGKTVPAPDVPMQDHTEVPETQPAAASDTSAPVTNDEPATVEPVHEPLVTGPVATEEPAETPVEATVADELVKEPTEVAAELAEAVVADEPMTMETAVVADSATEGPDTEMPVVPTAEEPAVVVAATEDPLTETPIEHAADELMIESAEKPTVDTPVEVKVENLAEETEIAEPEVPVTKEPAETEVPVTEECAEEPAETEMTATEEIPKGVEPEVQVPQLPAEPEVSATVEHPKDVEPEVPAAEECAEEFAETEMTATKECPKDVEPEMPVAEELAEDVEPKVPVTGEPAVVVEVATTEELVVEVAASVQVVEMTAALIVETAVESVDKRLSGSKRKLETSEDEGPEGETTAKKSRSRSRSASIEGTVAAGAVEELPEVNAVFPDFEASECSSETSSERRAREERSTRELVESVQQQGHGTITEVGVKRAAEVDPEHAAKKQKVEKTSTKKETEIKQPVVAEEPKKPEENKDEAMPEAADKAMPEAKEEKADDKKKEDEDEEEEEEEEEEEDDKLTEAAIKAMKYRELQAECKKRGLKASGKRDKLVETLIANQK